MATDGIDWLEYIIYDCDQILQAFWKILDNTMYHNAIHVYNKTFISAGDEQRAPPIGTNRVLRVLTQIKWKVVQTKLYPSSVEPSRVVHIITSSKKLNFRH